MVTLGHVVFYVRDLEKSTAFYRNVVGLTLAGRIFNGRAALLTGGSTHHELLLIEVGAAPGPLPGRRIGLYHVGWFAASIPGRRPDGARLRRSRIAPGDFVAALNPPCI